MAKKIAALFVMLFFSTICIADKVKTGDWWYDISDNAFLTEAFTGNNSGSTFGFICVISTNTCVYYVSPQATCNEDSTSAILINSDNGALSASTKCTKFGDTYYSIINETEDVHLAVIKSKNMGIAFPMESGQFRVVRFSLVGANVAIMAASKSAAKLGKNLDQIL